MKWYSNGEAKRSSPFLAAEISIDKDLREKREQPDPITKFIFNKAR
jgi:hypothetical protein